MASFRVTSPDATVAAHYKCGCATAGGDGFSDADDAPVGPLREGRSSPLMTTEAAPIRYRRRIRPTRPSVPDLNTETSKRAPARAPGSRSVSLTLAKFLE